MGILSSAAPIGEALKLANTLLSPLFNRGGRQTPAPVSPGNNGQAFAAALKQSTRAAEAAARQTFEGHDLNGDGFLTIDELGISPDAFAQMDANGDGKLDLAELTRAYAQRQYNASGQVNS